jgi:transcriptional regulator with XRE-family HTH domain
MTQQDVAQIVEVDKAYISKLESGKKLPSIAMIDRLAAALNMAAADLVSATELAGRYTAKRAKPGDAEIQDLIHRRRKSMALVAVHEVYLRLCTLHHRHLTGTLLSAPDAYTEALYQHLTGVLDETCEKVKEEAGLDLRSKLHVMDSLDPSAYLMAGFFDNESQDYDQQELLRSEAMILKHLFKYPEADDATARAEVRERLSLLRVDQHIQKLDEESARRIAASGGDIPF